jgi:transposase
MADSPTYTGFVGIDVSAKTFTATWTPSGPPRPQTFDQTSDGYLSFLAQLQTSALTPAATLMVMEATGCYWVTLAVTIHQAGYHVAVMNPMHTTNFARSLPRRAKTDALDADLLLAFARERRPAPWTPPPAVYHELRQRLLARDALMEMRQQARNQRHALDQWPVQIAAVSAQFNEIIADFDARIAHLDQEIAQNLQHGAWATSATLLASIPGLGPTTCAWLLVATINFTVAETSQSLAAYVGLAVVVGTAGSARRSISQP